MVRKANYFGNHGYVTPKAEVPNAKRVFGWVAKATGRDQDLLDDGPATFIGYYSERRPYGYRGVTPEQVEPYYGGTGSAKVFGWLEGDESQSVQDRKQIAWLME